jgi:hypothetical protein
MIGIRFTQQKCEKLLCQCVVYTQCLTLSLLQGVTVFQMTIPWWVWLVTADDTHDLSIPATLQLG